MMKNRAFLLVLASCAWCAAAGQSVTPLVTSGDRSYLLSEQPTVNFGTTYSTTSSISLDASTTYQEVDGFGFTFTEASAEAILSLSSDKQNELLNEIFNPTTGMGSAIIRIGIGATDLSTSTYSYDDVSGDYNLDHFSLDGPDKTYLIPLLKRALAINPDIKILATPWSAPAWMKISDNNFLQNSLYSNYAQYFVKYLQAMSAEGLSVWAVTPQNEPENTNNDPSMGMTKEDQLTFINDHLGPALANAGYGSVKIICFDHNCDNTEFPTYVSNNSSYVDGAAFHLYAGDISALGTYRSNTGKNVYFTEQYTSIDGDFQGDFSWHVKNVMIGSMNNYAKIAMEWNLANNASYSGHTNGGCTTCKGAITVDNSSSYTRNVAYYIIGQLSKYVRPGAVRIGCSSSSLPAVAFRNTDGSYVLTVLNENTSYTHTTTVTIGGASFSYEVPKGAAVTFRWGGSSLGCTATTDRAVATFCSDINYGGTAVGLPEGTFTTSQMSDYCLADNDISSLKVLPGYKVTVYKDDNFGGGSAEFTASTSWIGNDWNDAVSSIKIEAQGVSGLSGVYKIEGYNGQFLDLDGNTTADNTHVVQWTDEATEYYQQWRFDEIGNGVYNIRPASDTGKAMDVSWGSVDNRTEVLVYSNSGYSNQQFVVADAGDGYYQIIARYCGKVIEVPDFSTTAGEYIKLYDNNNQTCSFWKIWKQSPSGYPVATVYDDLNYGGASLALPYGEYTAERLSAYNFTPGTLTSLKVAAGFEATLYTGDNLDGNSLALTGDVTYVGADWNDAMRSISVRPKGVSGKSGYWKMQGRASGLFWDMDANASANGTKVVQWTDEGWETYQKFRLTELSDGVYQIANGGSLDKVVEVYGASNDNFAGISLYDNNGGDHQKFVLVDAGDGYYQFVVLQNAKVVELIGNSTDAGIQLNIYDNNNQYCSHWSLSPTGGVQVSAAASGSVKAYPNPMSSTLTVSGLPEGSLVRLYDAAGAVVMEIRGGGTLMLPVSGLPKGRYVLTAGGVSRALVK